MEVNYLHIYDQLNLSPQIRQDSMELLLLHALNIFTVRTLSSEILNHKICLLQMMDILSLQILVLQKYLTKEEHLLFVELHNISLHKLF